MLKIAIGTTSSYKLRFIKEVLEEANLEAELLPFEVESGVSNQPQEEKETKEGSINRAKAALENCPDASIGLGMEVGYEPSNNKYFMHGWASIVDREGNVFSEQSSTLELPNFFIKYLTEADEIGDHVQEYKDIHENDSWKYFAEIIQFREPFIKESSRNVLLRYFYRNEY